MRDFQTRRILSCFVPVVALCASWTLGTTEAPGQTLKTIKERGSLICGINPGLPGFSLKDDRGNWTGRKRKTPEKSGGILPPNLAVVELPRPQQGQRVRELPDHVLRRQVV